MMVVTAVGKVLFKQELPAGVLVVRTIITNIRWHLPGAMIVKIELQQQYADD